MIQLKLTKNFFKIFTKQEKYLFFFLILSQILTASLELISIGALLPVFKSIIDPSWNEKFFNFISEEYRIYFIVSMVIIIFLFKILILLIITFLSGKFINKVSIRIVTQIYNYYLNESYQFHVDNNSSLLLRNMQYANGIDATIMRLVNFYSDLMLLILTFILIMFVDIKMTLIVISFLIFLLLSYSLVTKKNIKKYGEEDVNYNTAYLKNMIEGIKSFKEIFLLGKQNFFSERSKTYKAEALRYHLRFVMLETIPKYLIEIILVIFFLLVATYISQDKTINLIEFLPFLAIVFIGVIRISPKILGVLNSSQQFKYLIPQIETVYKNLVQSQKINNYKLNFKDNEIIEFNSEILFDKISFNYKNKNILNKLSLTIKKNSCISIQGLSGSGKSTFLNILSGVLKPNSGNILIDGKKTNLNNSGWQKKIGYLSQKTILLDDTIKANIAFGVTPSHIDNELVLDCINKAELVNFINNLSGKLNTEVGENGARVSGGQAQRIGLARVFYKKPEVLILDEPTNSLDSESEIKIMNSIKKLKHKITIIIVSHNEKPLEMADEKYLMKNGSLIKKNF